MSPGELLRADRVELATVKQVLERAAHYRLELDRRLAKLIVSEMSVWLNKGRR